MQVRKPSTIFGSHMESKNSFPCSEPSAGMNQNRRAPLALRTVLENGSRAESCAVTSREIHSLLKDRNLPAVCSFAGITMGGHREARMHSRISL